MIHDSSQTDRYRLENMKVDSVSKSVPLQAQVTHPLKCNECEYRTSLANARNMYRHLRSKHTYDEKRIAQFKAQHITKQSLDPPRDVVVGGDEQVSASHHLHNLTKSSVKDPLRGTMKFLSNDDFEDWFENISHETCTSFITKWKKVSKKKVLVMFSCDRSHSGERKVKTKLIRPKKVTRICGTYAKVEKFNTGEIIVSYFIGHSHTLDPSKSSLTKREKIVLKSIMEDGILSNGQVVKKIELLEKHPNSRLNFIGTSQICELRRSWKVDKSRLSKRDFESLRLRIAEHGAEEGIISFNSEVELDGSEFELVTDWSLPQNIKELQRRFLLGTNELMLNIHSSSAQTALRNICGSLDQNMTLNMPSFTVHIDPRKEQAGTTQKHVPIRQVDKMFAQCPKRLREDPEEPRYQ